MRLEAALAIVLTLATPPPAAQPPSFRSATDAVRVDVAVTRGGRAVTGLSSSDFELRDSGVPQTVEVLSLEDASVNLVLAIDTSLSVQGETLQRLKEAAHAAVATLRSRDSVVLLTFSHLLQRYSSSSSDRSILDRAIDSAVADGATALDDAAFVAMASAANASDRRTLVLLFTDGFDTASWLRPVAVIDQARRSDLVVDAVMPATSPAMTGDGPALPGARKRQFLDEPLLFRGEFPPTLVDEPVRIRSDRTESEPPRAFVRIVSSFRERYILTLLTEMWRQTAGIRLTFVSGTCEQTFVLGVAIPDDSVGL